MKKRYWIIGGVALIGIASMIGNHSSPANLCSRPATKAALDQAFTGKLARVGARLLDDYAIHGQQGEAAVCSVSFALRPLTGAPDGAIGEAPTTAAEVEGYAMAFAMLPNLVVYSQTDPGKPLVQRVTYRVTKTLDDRVLVTIVDFPGARNLR